MWHWVLSPGCFCPCKACAQGKGFLLPFRDLLKWNLKVIVSSQKGAFTFKSVLLVCVAAVEVYSWYSSGTQRREIFIANILLQLCICFLCSLFLMKIFMNILKKKISWVNHFPSEFLNSWPLTMIIPNIVLMFVGRFWILWTTSLLLQRIHYLEDQKSVTAEKGRAERICTSFEQWKFVLQGHKAGAARQLHSSLINQKQLMRLTVSFKGSRDAFFFSLLSVDLEILIWLIQI